MSASRNSYGGVKRTGEKPEASCAQWRKATVLHEIAERDGAVFVGCLVEILNC